MCGRFALNDYKGVRDLFRDLSIEIPEGEPRYNIAPGSLIPGLLNDLIFRFDIRWGMTPPWAKENTLLFNARSETIHSKTSFKKHIKLHRMIFPASGFYEWKKEGNQKTPFYFTSPDGFPFALAGIYRVSKDGIYQACMITTEASNAMKSVHDRQPVIIAKSEIKEWLTSEDETIVDRMMQPSESLNMIQVSSYVNHSQNEGPDCIRSVS
ncbi:MAG: SOS response-associated peptidase [Spirochaetia bacterium]|nr:SOS response-associated peptidase [Spirochaetia bacterium]